MFAPGIRIIEFPQEIIPFDFNGLERPKERINFDDSLVRSGNGPSTQSFIMGFYDSPTEFIVMWFLAVVERVKKLIFFTLDHPNDLLVRP